jgi:hypothetical protein
MRMQNFRSFVDSGRIELSSVNVLIGANNSGKSSILRGLHQLQAGLTNPFGDVRVGSARAQIEIELLGVAGEWGLHGNGIFLATIDSADQRSGSWNGSLKIGNTSHGGNGLPNVEPAHFIVPYLSKRKAATYDEDIREQYVMAVMSDVRNLAAKLSRLSNPAFPAFPKYAEACKAILGFVVTAIPSQNGQRPGIYLPTMDTIPIEQMGDGVPNIAHLLINLATSSGKLFLVEEPENDLHPSALKALLDLVAESSSINQFVVSTHSNIVVRHLCSLPDSRLFRVSSELDELPTVSKVETVPPTPEARIAVLQELGYTFSDFELWDGWLILEESSAERIIRDYLIPWFSPKLSRIRTFSAGGVDRVEPALDDFLRLTVFTHLQPAYAGRTWVRVDGDDAGKTVASSLKGKYRDWPEDRINSYPAEQFEYFYPEVFADEIAAALAIKDRQVRRQAKRELLEQVRAWLDDDFQRGKSALEHFDCRRTAT